MAIEGKTPEAVGKSIDEALAAFQDPINAKKEVRAFSLEETKKRGGRERVNGRGRGTSRLGCFGLSWVPKLQSL
jgi:hypothetical protein